MSGISCGSNIAEDATADFAGEGLRALIGNFREQILHNFVR